MTPRKRRLLLAAAVLLAVAGVAGRRGADVSAVPGKLFVLVVYESADLPKLPAGQVAVLTSTKVRKYLYEHCAIQDGQPACRIFDVDDDLSRESADWQAMMKRPRQSLPWLTLAAGGRNHDGPLPESVDAMLALLEKYGGK